MSQPSSLHSPDNQRFESNWKARKYLDIYSLIFLSRPEQHDEEDTNKSDTNREHKRVVPDVSESCECFPKIDVVHLGEGPTAPEHCQMVAITYRSVVVCFVARLWKVMRVWYTFFV